ncbi:DUF1565 domain-containing protein [Tautonia rosea]|uniref:DUF1565 domain-containing protein n=1 Tax=Tautonia rosea TaxID=2728037 RepID=UPI0014760802|nr:DUF1565 domain-containing protein [Tautonia rosea]
MRWTHTHIARRSWIIGVLGLASGLGVFLMGTRPVEAGPRKIIVDAVRGNDVFGRGTRGRPYKTITVGLNAARPGDTVFVQLGLYDASNGEKFPIRMKPGVALKGQKWPPGRGRFPFREGIVGPDGGLHTEPMIQGGDYVDVPFGDGLTTERFVTIMGADEATIANFVIFVGGVEVPAHTGTGILCDATSPKILSNTFRAFRPVMEHEGIMILGSGAPEIRQNLFKGNMDWGITTHGESAPQITDNRFATNDGGIDTTRHSTALIRDNVFTCRGTGISAREQSTPAIESNTIRGHESYGIFCGQEAAPVIRNNVIERNGTGIDPIAGPLGGVVIFLDAQPDLGGGDGVPGGNVLRENNARDVVNFSPNTIWALGNTWTHSAATPHLIDDLDVFDDDENPTSGPVIFAID